jgi:hypothetical protein
MSESPAFPVARIRDAFEGNRCVTAWLGYGSVLFLDFGETVLRERDEAGRRTLPPFELEINFANWHVEAPKQASTLHSDRDQLEAAARSLIGERVVSWELPQNTRLRIHFTGNKQLAIDGWDVGEGLAAVWSLEAPDGHILAAATDGRLAIVDSSLPILDWFDSHQL